MVALSLDDDNVVASAERLIGLHPIADVALVVEPLTVPAPEIVTVFPGPGMASPWTVLDEIVILPFDRIVPWFVRPLDAMPTESIVPPPDIVKSPHEKTPCEATAFGTVNESEATAAG
jgi:hypothetical protein